MFILNTLSLTELQILPYLIDKVKVAWHGSRCNHRSWQYVWSQGVSSTLPSKKGIKPVIGCEIYVAKRSIADVTGKEDRSGDHLILLAKNLTGYKNLIKLVSTAWIKGFYYKPRIDKELLAKYREGLIASSACLAGEIQDEILNGTMTGAEAALKSYLDIVRR